MENIDIPNSDYSTITKALRSLGDRDLLQPAKDDHAIEKEEIKRESRLELSGLETTQRYSSEVMTHLDLVNTLELRREWSGYIKHGFYLMVGMQILIIPVLLLLMLVTSKVSFDNIHNIIYIIIGTNFVQIIGLVLVVVKFLFPQEVIRKKD